jgi:hypothetical protein
MSIEWTTSANNTVTCLYSADWEAFAAADPHSLQNLAVAARSVPHDPQVMAAAASAPQPSPLSSTSVSFHRWSDMSAKSHLGRRLIRLSPPQQRPSTAFTSAPVLITCRGRRSRPALPDPNYQRGTGFSGLLAADGVISRVRRCPERHGSSDRCCCPCTSYPCTRCRT